jgi:hypothetical protein
MTLSNPLTAFMSKVLFGMFNMVSLMLIPIMSHIISWKKIILDDGCVE